MWEYERTGLQIRGGPMSMVSINQPIKFYSANIHGKARLSGATAESVFNSKIDEAVLYQKRAIARARIYERKAKSKRCAY